MQFCTDLDLLRYEPLLFQEILFPSQLLIRGTGALASSTLTIASGSFTDANISSGHICTLATPIDASVIVRSVTSSAAIVLSVDPDDTVPIGSAESINFTIHTFAPQIELASNLILQSAGLNPESTEVLNTSELVRPTVLATLQIIFNAQASIDPEADSRTRAELYARLFQRAFRQTRLSIDSDNDGIEDRVIYPGLLNLLRR